MWLFNRKGPSGFSSLATAEEVTEGIDGSGLTAIVTGASSGIGSETARVLAVRGVHIIMGVRNMSTGGHVKQSILKEVPSAKIDLFKLDLSSMASVKNFVSDFISMNLPLNILINNAGIMATPFLLSDDGVELQFATNHIGHFLLTDLLLDKMKETSSKSNIEGRIVNVTADSHRFSYPEGIRFDMINDDSGYNEYLAYGQSKLANILHANELARRLQDDKVRITANSVHPGTIATNMFRDHGTIKAFMNTVAKMMTKTIEQGAATTCYVALHPQVNGVTGKYFNNCNISEPSPQATDAELAKRLWELSMNLISN